MEIKTLEEAIRAEAAWQEELQLAKQALSDSETQTKALKAKRRICEARCWLEELNGYVEYDLVRDANGNPVREGGAFVQYNYDKIVRRVEGVIQQLAGEAQRLKEESSLGKRFSERTFENFDTSNAKDAYKSAVKYAEREDLFKSNHNCKILTGNVGTGKTHLAAAISNRLIERGIPVLFGTFTEHLDRIKEEFNNTTLETYKAKMKSVPMLVIDDLGKERKTEWTQSILYDVVNHRYERLMPMVITTNLDDSELLSYVGNAVASRLYEMGDVIRTVGIDYRQKL